MALLAGITSLEDNTVGRLEMSEAGSGRLGQGRKVMACNAIGIELRILTSNRTGQKE